MAAHYEDESIAIHKFKCGPYDNNAYLLVCPHTNASIVIDTPAGAGEMVEAAKGTDVKAILITHNHTDHLLGFSEITSALDAPVGIGEPDASALESGPDFHLEDSRAVEAGTISLTALFTPGHTPGSTCLRVDKHLFTGDTLFPGGPGKTGSPKNLAQVIDGITGRLFTLEEGLTFYPGHGADGELDAARDEYGVFAGKQHPADLCGDVLWLQS